MLARSSRTKSKEKLAHPSGTISKIVIMRPLVRRYNCLESADADADADAACANEYNIVGSMTSHPRVWEWVAH